MEVSPFPGPGVVTIVGSWPSLAMVVIPSVDGESSHARKSEDCGLQRGRSFRAKFAKDASGGTLYWNGWITGEFGVDSNSCTTAARLDCQNGKLRGRRC